MKHYYKKEIDWSNLMATAVAYYRTSSAANVGEDKDSLRRQQEAVMSYADNKDINVVEEFRVL